MAVLTAQQIYTVALQAGFSPEQAVTFTAIALAESSGDPQANAPGSEDSRGLWQINVSPGVRPDEWGDTLYDPLVNARAAYEISGGGTNLKPWVVTHGDNPPYLKYLDDSRAAAQAVGSGAGPVPVPDTSGSVGDEASGGGAAEKFVQLALAQVGDRYVYGVDVDLDDADPAKFDCAELTEWAAHQVGVEIGNSSYDQYLELSGQGAEMDVEQALRTRGALLFTFSTKPIPGGGRPSEAHVAISLGDGRVVEAASPEAGVRISDAGDRFNYAASIPGLATATPGGGIDTAIPGGDVDTATSSGDVDAYALPLQDLPHPTDSDADGLTDKFETLLGTDPQNADSDHDQLFDLVETTKSHTDPLQADTDTDSVPDSIEVAEGTDAGTHRLSDEVVAAGFGGAATADVDNDGLSDLTEFQLGSDRDSFDTDIDGVSDDWEYALGSDLSSIDSDHDGVVDGVEMDMGTLDAARSPLLPPSVGAGGAEADPGSDARTLSGVGGDADQASLLG